MKKKKISSLTGISTLAILAAGCASGPVTYVTASDPVLSICQQPSIENIGDMQLSVDNANNTNDRPNGGGTGQQMSDSQIYNLKTAVSDYRRFAGMVPGHPNFATALYNEAQEFTVAASSPTGLTTNSVAIAVDKYAGEITGICGSYRVGTAPKAVKPGPGIWDRGLFWAAAGIYIFLVFACSFILALGERAKPRKSRISPGKIFWLSVIWPLISFAVAAHTYRQVIESLKVTPAEKQEDRLKALTDENTRLEKENLKLKKFTDGDS